MDVIQVNFPKDMESFNSGNGEGCWLEVDDYVKKMYDENYTGGTFEGILTHESVYYPDLISGDKITFSMYGKKRPVATYKGFLDTKMVVDDVFINESCYFCNTKNVEHQIIPNIEGVRIKCPNCGLHFLFTSNKEMIYENKTIISGYLFETRDRNTVLELTSKTIEDILRSPIVPQNPDQKIEKLIMYLYKNNRGLGFVFDINKNNDCLNRVYNNPNFLYLNDKSELDWILNTLEEEKYIRIVRAKQSRNIINAFRFTSNGFKFAEKLINKTRNDIGNETIYRRSEVMSNLFLFVTANDNEKEAFEDFFVVEKTDFIKAKAYKIGKFGLYSVAHIHINEQGTTNPESIPLVGELIRKIKPLGVIMVGIAFGANECTQKIGDVLVSKKILNYDSEKIRENDNLYKEDPKEVGFQLFNAFCNDDDWIYPINDSGNSRVHKGAMLTGSKLINNEGFKQKLLNDFQNFSPIGGEMEAYGIYSICRVHGVNEWIIVKAICDWAYNKDTDKEKNQKVASKAAVNFCNHVFSCKGIFDDLLKSESEMNSISEEVKKNIIKQ